MPSLHVQAECSVPPESFKDLDPPKEQKTGAKKCLKRSTAPGEFGAKMPKAVNTFTISQDKQAKRQEEIEGLKTAPWHVAPRSYTAVDSHECLSN